ncbi:hypothetical protein [Staphylococcus delphini]|uniref:hypothetical protein n=1 Tax=Staphylococcus delphini TaxID=53344 RepID=UPI003742D912
MSFKTFRVEDVTRYFVASSTFNLNRIVDTLSSIFSHTITTDDDTNPWILMSDDLSELINTKIYLVENFNTLERYIGYIDGIEHMLEVAKGRVVA